MAAVNPPVKSPLNVCLYTDNFINQISNRKYRFNFIISKVISIIVFLTELKNKMLKSKKVVVVMPAYNAAETLEKTYNEIPFSIVDEVILVDDFGQDNTAELASKLGIKHVIVHEFNKGYGGNQKTCYNKAIEIEADIVVMLHPDYQYTPKLIESMCHLIANELYPVVLGSRILGKGALKGVCLV